jgi:hypothetical protein
LDGLVQDDRYSIVNDIIYYKGGLYLVLESGLKKKILQEAHDSPLAGHQGFLKIYIMMRERFSSKGLKDNVLKYVKECSTCQQNKVEHTHPVGLLQPLPIPKGKWESIYMDFITRLPKVQGRDCIYVVVDRLNNFTHFFAIPSDYLGAQVAEVFFREVFLLHGLPRTIVSDKDNRFMGDFWRDCFRVVGIDLTPSTSYHPQTNGQNEIVNKWLEGYLRNYVVG